MNKLIRDADESEAEPLTEEEKVNKNLDICICVH